MMVAVTTLGRVDYAAFVLAYFAVQMLVTGVVLFALRRLLGRVAR